MTEIPRIPDLPSFLRRGRVVVNVLPDVEPRTWSIWDLDGCIGQIAVDGDGWTARQHPGGHALGVAVTWQESVALVLGSRDSTYR